MTERSYSRRAVAIGGGIAAALGLTALGVSIPGLFHRYRRTPYDDLLALLVDREAAVRVGKALDAQIASRNIYTDVLPPGPAELAKMLRKYMNGRSLADVTKTELAQGKLIEVKGWVLPETLVGLAWLAAHS